MQTITIGDLISGLVDVYERQYEDHELATVKAALVMDELLRGSRPARAARAARAARSLRAMRGNARKAA
jgi:hypothetical protein